MKRWPSLVVIGVLAITMSVVQVHGRPTAATGTPVGRPAGCSVTEPNGNMPPGSGNPEFIGGYGNDALWTNLWMWGKGVPVKPNPARPGETEGPGKWAWYRYVPGELTI